MDFEIKVSADKSFIIANVFRPLTRVFIFEVNQALVKEALKLGINKFLYDVRSAINDGSVFDNYQISYEDAEKVQFPKISRFAILHKEDDNSHDFIKTVALNAGYRLELFTDEQKAIEWMRT